MTAAAARLQVGPGSGHLLVRTRREGIAATAGHDLTIEVTRWSAEVEPAGEAATSRVSATVDLTSLEVRDATGGAAPLTASDRAEIQRAMRRQLGGAEATFASARVIPAKHGGAIEGTLALNGVTQPIRLEVSGTDGVHYRGRAAVRQTAFGLKPYATLFGMLRVRDEVTVEFDVDLSEAKPA